MRQPKDNSARNEPNSTHKWDRKNTNPEWTTHNLMRQTLWQLNSFALDRFELVLGTLLLSLSDVRFFFFLLFSLVVIVVVAVYSCTYFHWYAWCNFHEGAKKAPRVCGVCVCVFEFVCLCVLNRYLQLCLITWRRIYTAFWWWLQCFDGALRTKATFSQ